MAGRLSQPGCHTNTGAGRRSGRSTVKLEGLLPEDNRSLRKTMRGAVRKPKTKIKNGMGVFGRQSSSFQLSSKPVKRHFKSDRERVRFAVGTFRKMLGAASPSHSQSDVFVTFKLQHSDLLFNKGHIEGHVPGVEAGDTFRRRIELRVASLHRRTQAGIDWTKLDGIIPSPEGYIDKFALSIVVSGSYEDDVDEGEVLIYTGEGGKDSSTNQQVANQKLEGGNEALRNSCILKNSVRVIRGRPDPTRPGGTVFSYDGLYKVTDWSWERGRSDFFVYRFTLVREPGQKPLIWPSPVVCRSGLWFR